MTEVPEVETLVRDLREAVTGRAFTGVEVLQPAAVRYPSVPEFTALLSGRGILDANRRAKFILMSLTGDLVLAVHFMLWALSALRRLPSRERPKP